MLILVKLALAAGFEAAAEAGVTADAAGELTAGFPAAVLTAGEAVVGDELGEVPPQPASNRSVSSVRTRTWAWGMIISCSLIVDCR